MMTFTLCEAQAQSGGFEGAVVDVAGDPTMLSGLNEKGILWIRIYNDPDNSNPFLEIQGRANPDQQWHKIVDQYDNSIPDGTVGGERYWFDTGVASPIPDTFHTLYEEITLFPQMRIIATSGFANQFTDAYLVV